MKLEVGKKYRVKNGNAPWEVLAIDRCQTAWGICRGLVMSEHTAEPLAEWHDKPDPGEGWRLLEVGEDLQIGDECYLKFDDPYDDWAIVNCSNNKQTPGMYYRRRITPKYVPYTWDDRDELRGRWYRQGSLEVAIKSFQNLGSGEFRINNYSPEKFLELCEWLDGTPCGKQVV